MLTLLFHVDLRYAVGASLVSVIATSSGRGGGLRARGIHKRSRRDSARGRDDGRRARRRALCRHHPTRAYSAILFGVVLLVTAYRVPAAARRARAASRRRTSGRCGCGSIRPIRRRSGEQAYSVTNVPAGFALMFLAGILSALLGIGSGIIKVLAMDQMMRLPFKVSTTTSNFMIGVTAAASAGVLSPPRLHRSDARVAGDARRAQRRVARRAHPRRAPT